MSLKYAQFDASELEDIDKMMHLTNHRHRNQHRPAKWWKSFQILKRNASKLLAELETHKKAPTKSSRTAIEERVEFILRILLPKCYRSFAAVVADNQFAALGLMLMGTLARLNKILRPLRREVAIAAPMAVDVERDSVLEEVGELVARSPRGEGSLPSHGEPDGPSKMALGASKRKSKQAARSSSMLSLPDDASPKPSRKKRKKGDAISDLFSSIL